MPSERIQLSTQRARRERLGDGGTGKAMGAMGPGALRARESNRGAPK